MHYALRYLKIHGKIEMEPGYIKKSMNYVPQFIELFSFSIFRIHFPNYTVQHFVFEIWARSFCYEETLFGHSKQEIVIHILMILPKRVSEWFSHQTSMS